MKYYLDTEFHEYERKTLFSKPTATIDLISIGIVSEEGKEYYAICNEFDIKAAWNNKWLKENVLKQIWIELFVQDEPIMVPHDSMFFYKDFVNLIKKYGKSKEQIAKEILDYIQDYQFDDTYEEGDRFDSAFGNGKNNTYYFVEGEFKSKEYEGTSHSDLPEFYAYYADYDWIVFCWLFGRMIDLPEGFPMYCKDLKQILDEKALNINNQDFIDQYKKVYKGIDLYHTLRHEDKIKLIKHDDNYPKQVEEHNALADAKWNMELHKFINTL